MPASAFAQQQLADEKRLMQLAVEQGEFDFLMPYGERRSQLAPKEVANCIGRSLSFVYERVEAGDFEAHGTLAVARNELRINRRSVLLWFARTALYQPQYFLDRLLKCVDALTPRQCDEIIKRASARRARL